MHRLGNWLEKVNMDQPKKLWGGRFTGEADEKFVEFNRSFGFDRRLFEADVRGSLAHSEGLRRAGVLTDDEGDKIRNGLLEILEKGVDAEFFAGSSAEDIHSFIESRLVEMIGDAGQKLHT